MKTTFKFTIIILLMCFASRANSQDLKPNETNKEQELITNKKKQNAEALTEQPYLFLSRMQKNEHTNLMQSSMWTLTHDYKDKENVDEVLNSFSDFMKSVEDHGKNKNDADKLKSEYNKFKDKLILWTESDDQSVRAFSATIIGITGDKSLINNLLMIINRKLDKDELVIYDRRQAAISIGLLEAKEHSSELIKLLKSPNNQDKIGGLYGLAFLNSKDFISEMENLLKDEDEEVQMAATEAIKMINSKQQ